MKNLFRLSALMFGACAGIGLSASAATFDIPNGDVAALKSALTTSSNNGVDDIINLASGGTYTLSTVDNTLAGNNGLPAIFASGALVINGNSATIERGFAQGQTPVDFRIFYVRIDANATFNDLTLRNGSLAASGGAGGFGAAIYSRGTLAFNRGRITGCVSKSAAGAIQSLFTAYLTLTDSRFDNNSGQESAVTSSSLSDSSRPGSLLATNCIFENNTGGGLRAGAGSGAVTNCIMRNNQSGVAGGGLSIVDSTVTVRDCAITGNTVTDTEQNAGGGFFNFRGVTLLENCTISGNSVVINGAPSVQGFGGGICHFDDGSQFARGALTISNCTISGNSAGMGGGVYLIGEAAQTVVGITIRNSTIAGNTAAGDGGGFFNLRGAARIENTTITNNTASNGAGVAEANGTEAKTTLANTIVANNSGNDIAQVTNPETPDATGTSLQSAGYNVVGSGNAASLFVAAGDKTGVSDARLGPLANNGGTTQTVALLAGSPAINAGDPGFDGTGKFDQRGTGFARVQQGRLDVGAFEAGLVANTPPTLGNALLSGTTQGSVSYQLMGRDADGDTLTYTLDAGSALPPGLTLSSAGLVSGVPTQTTASSRFFVTVSDGNGGRATGRVTVIINSKVDGVAPKFTRNGVPASLTRDELAALTLSGDVTDLASAGVTPSGVNRVQVQLRNSAGRAYNGSQFTDNLTPYYFAGLSGDNGDPAATRVWNRPLSFVPGMDLLAPGDYTLLILSLDIAGNYSGDYANFTIIAPPAARLVPPTNGSSGRLS